MGLLDRLFGGSRRTASDVAEPADAGKPAAAAPGRGDGPETNDRAWTAIDRIRRGPAMIQPIEEQEAQGEVAAVYEQVKRDMQIPAVPEVAKAIAHSPEVLKTTLGALALAERTSLPQPVVNMLLYSIAMALECQYCSSFHRLTCRTIGIDDATLFALGNDLDSVVPERVQAIVKFGTKAAMSPKALEGPEYERLRELGISETEIVEIVGLAALARFTNVLADALKIDVDPMVRQALAA